MAYVHCMPARVVALSHGLDNIVTGMLRTDDGDVPFRTRGHVVKATNKIYRNCDWKPKAGDDVLIDAEVSASGAVVDHVEYDRHAEIPVGAASPHLDAIAALLPRHPPATKTLRVNRTRQPIRLRFAAMASRRDNRGRVHDEVVHAAYNAETDAWSLWTTRKEGGDLCAKGIDANVMPILARAAGMDMLSGETERERGERIEREEVAATRDASRPSAPLSDDCPF